METNALITRETAEALISSRESFKIQDMALMTPESFAELKREYFARAREAGIINIVVMLTQSRGASTAGNQTEWTFSWNGEGIPPVYQFRATYGPATGVIEATVNGHLVLSNLTPGGEMLLPGEWMRRIAEIVQAAEAESIWRDQIDKGRAQIQAITDFSADV